MELHHVDLDIAKKRKLLNGHQVQLRNEHLCKGSGYVVLDKKQSTKLKRALKMGTGVRIQFHSPELIHNNVMHGSGFRDLLSKAKRALYSVHGHLQNAGVYDHVRSAGHKLDQHLRDSGVYDQVKSAGKNFLKDQAHHFVGKAAGKASEAIGHIADRLPEQYQNDFHMGATNLLANQVGHAHDSIAGQGIGKTERKIINGFRQVGRTLNGVVHSKVGKQILGAVAKVGIPAVLGAVQASTGAPAEALAPGLTGAAVKGINGLGLAKARAAKARKAAERKGAGYRAPKKRARRGGALIASGY